ncbi:MAG TPA: SO2930 family diheme c-type cytochrome, partial [Steroidobacteraceae bacterium]
MSLKQALSRVALVAGVFSGSWLAGCSHPHPAVHYFAHGRPQHLSEWQVVYSEGGRLEPNERVVTYDLNTPLFSDYAHKFRTVWMPAGKAARYAVADTFDFPVGTIISKTFYYPRAAGAERAVLRTYDQSRDFAGPGLDLANVRLIETRILVRREQGWEALPYVWNADQTDAELARTGDEVSLELVASGEANEPFTYVVPNEVQCAGCHVADLKAKSIAPIGLKARHLNRLYTYATGAENQLSYLQKVGYLAGLPALADVPRNANWRDAAQPLDARARAYLDINCAHCHSATGPADTTGLTFESITATDRHLGICKPPVAAGRGTGDHLYDIV